MLGSPYFLSCEDTVDKPVEPAARVTIEARVKLGTGGLERLDWTAPEARAGKGWTASGPYRPRPRSSEAGK
jgi:hypothetical protein